MNTEQVPAVLEFVHLHGRDFSHETLSLATTDFVGTTAKTSDMSQFANLLHGDEVRISADGVTTTRRFTHSLKRI